MLRFIRWVIAVTVVAVVAAGSWLTWNQFGYPRGGGDPATLRNDNAIALAAVLSAAIGGGLSWWAGRDRKPQIALKVDVSLLYRTSGRDKTHRTTKGTPIQVRRGRDVQDEEVTLSMTVANAGERAVQVSAVVLEAVAGTSLNIRHITTEPLPAILEPYTSIDLEIQKEHIDFEDQITFLGVVDALGNRYAAPKEQSIRTITAAWSLPTRVDWFRRRDDPSGVVRAYQSAENSRLSHRSLSTMKKRPATLAARPVQQPPSASSQAGGEAKPGNEATPQE